MKEVRWAQCSEIALNDFVDYLATIDGRLADRALADIGAAMDLVALQPDHGRASRWPGYREKSVLKWRKILVYQVTDDQVTVMGFFDARQDLTQVTPEG